MWMLFMQADLKFAQVYRVWIQKKGELPSIEEFGRQGHRKNACKITWEGSLVYR